MKSNEPKKRKKESPFAKNLQQVLSERGVSQADAARLAGVQRSVVGDWLAGTTPQDLKAVQKLATALNACFEWLLTGTTSKKQHSDELPLGQLFDIETDSSFSGLFLLEAKRLKRKTNKKEGME